MSTHKASTQNANTGSGYILISSLLILTTLTTIATYMMTRGSIFAPFIRTAQDREKAIAIARGGIEVAIAQLSRNYQESKKNDISTANNTGNTTKNAQHSEDYQFLTHILPTINRWQEYNLEEKADGIDARMRICIMCEEGKININTAYDYTTKKFVGNWQTIIQTVCTRIEQIQGGTRIFNALESFLNNRRYKLIDVTELLHVKEFDIFREHQTYEPPAPATQDSQPIRMPKPIYLTDIFTVDTNTKIINPWFFSNSLLAILSLPAARHGDIQERIDNMSNWLKSAGPAKSWTTDWKTLLEPLYQKDLSQLPENIASLFDTSARPRIFSVLSEGQVGTATKRLFAILERKKYTHKNKIRYDVKLRKLYWL